MPSKSKATAIRFPDQMKANIALVATSDKLSAHAAVLKLVAEALAARGLGSPAFTKIAAGLKEVAEFAEGKTTALVHSPRTGKTKTMTIKQATAEQKRVVATPHLDVSMVEVKRRERWHPMPKSGKK